MKMHFDISYVLAYFAPFDISPSVYNAENVFLSVFSLSKKENLMFKFESRQNLSRNRAK